MGRGLPLTENEMPENEPEYFTPLESILYERQKITLLHHLKWFGQFSAASGEKSFVNMEKLLSRKLLYFFFNQISCILFKKMAVGLYFLVLDNRAILEKYTLC